MAASNDPVSEEECDHEAPRPADALAGRRILIVEDDPFIALALEEILSEHGLIVVGPARDLRAALDLAAGAQIDIALLDVNVGSEKIDPVADLLAQRACPFLFVTGYGKVDLPEGRLSCAFIEKPFHIEDLIKALRDELMRRQTS